MPAFRTILYENNQVCSRFEQLSMRITTYARVSNYYL